MDDFVQSVQDSLTQLPGLWIAAGVGVVVLLAGMLIGWKFLRRKKPRRPVAPGQMGFDIGSLRDEGPPPGPPVLEFYNLPVRVAAIVLAPVGRVRELPPLEEFDPVYDSIVPGLDRLIALHEPLILRWPGQVSARGFSFAFFAQVRLPGEGGKGTPWSSAAGIFKYHGVPIMAGIVLRAESANSFGQVTIDREEKWLGCFRIRRAT